VNEKGTGPTCLIGCYRRRAAFVGPVPYLRF